MEYHISQVEANATTGVVHTSHWTLNHQDGVHHAQRYGSVYFPTDPAKDTPVQYNDLTEEQVLAWTQEILGAEYMASLEASILAEIEEKKNPTTLVGAPWATPPPPPPADHILGNQLPETEIGGQLPISEDAARSASEVDRLLAIANRKNDEDTAKYRR